MWQAHDFLRGVGKFLRAKHDDITHQRLPERWIDLIRYLDAKERRELERRQSRPRRHGHDRERST